MAKPAVIVWFRQDLRLADNHALAQAALTGAPIVALYILDETPGMRAIGGAGRWWLHQSLAALAASLRAAGSRLVLRRGAALQVLAEVVEETGAAEVYWNRVHDPAGIARDTQIKAELAATCHSFAGGLLNEPWEVRTAAGGPYQVFTPYWRAAAGRTALSAGLPAPARLPALERGPRSDALCAWTLQPRSPDWAAGFSEWQPGESGATAKLHAFLDGAASDYADGRDIPSSEGTSRLSPHLHFGEIGPGQVWRAVQDAAAARIIGQRQAEVFLKELGWREFNHQLLFHRPDIERGNFNAAFDAFPWRLDPPGLAAWRAGSTGYPIVDAGMRQLWATGWMHGRVRMIVASFLTKHLLIDWRPGEAWFWDTLVDADVANNVCNWQWTAGCGADAAPFFRIFNPTLQGQRFDPDGDYVRRWLPELERLPAKFIHQPWAAPTETFPERTWVSSR